MASYRDDLNAALERENALRKENDALREHLESPERFAVGHFGVVGWLLLIIVALCIGALVVIANPT